MSEGPEIAMENFSQSSMQGVSTGGSIGSSNGVQTAILPDSNVSFENAQKKFTSPDVFSYTLGKLLDGMQGWAASLTPANMFNSLSPPVTPISASTKIPSLFGGKGH